MADDGDDIIKAVWNGETFEPVGNWARAWCHDNLGAGEQVNHIVDRIRSGRSHRHQFAEIKNLWETFPESLSDAPYAKSPETLRKHALIATGFANVETIDAGNKKNAERWASITKQMAMAAHGYAVVQVRGQVVRIYTPESQSYKAMGKEKFQDSKQKVLDWINAKIEEAAKP